MNSASRGRSLSVLLATAFLFLSPLTAAGRPALSRGAVDEGRPALLPRASPLDPPQVHFERLTTAHGLSNSRVRAILQDWRGFLWIGTDDGLNRYDGYQFTIYRHDPADDASLVDNRVLALCEDRSGNLWVGTVGGLDRFEPASGTFAHYPSYLPYPAVLALLEDRSGTIWAGLDGGLARVDRERQLVAVVATANRPDDPEQLSGRGVQALYEDRQGNLWVGTAGGLNRFDRTTQTFVHYRHDPADPTSLSHDSVAAIAEDSRGTMWVATEGGGLDLFDRAGQTFVHYRHDPGDSGTLGDDRVTDIVEDETGRLWLATLNGLEWFDADQGRFTHFRRDPADPSSLSSNIVLALYEDSTGVVWIATYDGISKYSPALNRFAVHQADVGQPGGLSDSIIAALYEDSSRRLWIGTFNGGLNLLDPRSGQFSAYRHDPGDPDSLSDNFVRAIYEDRQGVLWIGTGGGWVEQFDPATGKFWHRFRLPSAVMVLAEDRAGQLWAGAQGLYLLDRDQWTYRRYLPATTADDLVVSLHADMAGRLWVGTERTGLNLWDDSGRRLLAYRHDSSGPGDPSTVADNSVLAIYEDPAGVLWLGTSRSGLERFDPSGPRWTSYGPALGMAGESVWCIESDAAGVLWLATDKGLSRFDPRTLSFHNYDGRDGLPGGGLTSCVRRATGEMLFGGLDGLVSFDPAAIRNNLDRPRVVITAMFKFNRQVPAELRPGSTVQLAYNDNFVSFDYAALDYQAPAKNQYAYRLEGLDPDWVYAGTRRHVDYPALPAGDYVFRVKAANNDGVWNEQGIAVAIVVVPPVWERWWFRGLAALLLIGVAVAGYGLRVRSLRARSRELSRLVDERTQALEQRRREIEQSRQELAALYQADEKLYRHLHLDQVLQALVDTAVDILQADKGCLLAWDERRERLVVRAARGFSPETVRTISLAPGQGVAGCVAVSGEPIIVPDVRHEPRVTKGIVEAEGIRSFMQVPLKIGGEVFGVFSADYTQARAFRPEETRLLIALAQRAALAIENAQLYERAQEAATMAERNRLSRDLHDSITQYLYSLTLLTEAGQRMMRARDLSQAEENQALLADLARQALQEMRLLVYELRPLAAEGEDLVGALEHRLEAVERRAGLEARLVVEGECRLPQDAQEELYRIAHEALNNALKHAQASAVVVTVRSGGESLSLEVQDNGRGFSLAGAGGKGGMGLQTMQERADKIGGRLTVRSAPGQGTSVQVVMPMQESSGPAAGPGPVIPGEVAT